MSKNIYIFFKLFCTIYDIKFGTFFDTLIFKDKEKIFFRIFANEISVSCFKCNI